MPHLILLGDSIFDNAPYTRGGPAVADHLRALLPPAWRTTLLAVDGSTTREVPAQLARLPADATHLAVSAGGNDALRESGVLDEPVRTVAAALARLGELGARFEGDYRRMLDLVLARGLPTLACTIYHPSLPDPRLERVYAAGLLPFNDAILWTAVARRVPLVDLRLVCTEPGDYESQIEPSVAGGAKIAAAVARAATGHRFDAGTASVYR